MVRRNVMMVIINVKSQRNNMVNFVKSQRNNVIKMTSTEKGCHFF